MGGVQFETTINLGNIITIFSGLIVWGITFAIAWTKFGNRIDMLDFRVELMEKVLDKIAVAIDKFTTNEKELALVKQQTAALELNFATLHKTVELLRAGNGWITNPRRGNVDGEYKRD